MSRTRNLLAASRTAGSPSPSRPTTSGASSSEWRRIASRSPRTAVERRPRGPGVAPAAEMRRRAQHSASAAAPVSESSAPAPASAPQRAPRRRTPTTTTPPPSRRRRDGFDAVELEGKSNQSERLPREARRRSQEWGFWGGGLYRRGFSGLECDLTKLNLVFKNWRI